MRIGTWNLAGRWTVAHRALLLEQGCDVWLLTEVREDVVLAGFQRHLTRGLMVEPAPRRHLGRHWAGVLSREPLDPLPDPHPASALATVDGVTYCSSILPWRTAGSDGSAAPWIGDTTASRMAATLDQLRLRLETEKLIWGGDWNQGLVGPEYAGTRAGRRAVLQLVDDLRLVVPTAELPHQRESLATIDHIAVARDLVVKAERQIAGGLSDHDLYIVEI